MIFFWIKDKIEFCLCDYIVEETVQKSLNHKVPKIDVYLEVFE